ncbi:glycosyltransferase [Arthrobacter phage Atuin]|nr:glycosyltransferase [Arthrobacter phage Atuin]
MVNPSLRIIVPSRGRPQNAHRLLKQIQDTAEGDLNLTFAVDYNDPTLNQYPYAYTSTVQGGSMVQALNEVATRNSEYTEYLAFLGDDTFPHEGWHSKVMTTLEAQKNSIVYGNDLIHGEGLPTSVFMDSNIVRTLGYMAPPNQKQLFVDNYWKALGDALGTLTYLNDVIIEHLHPIAHKAPSDASYEVAYSEDRWLHDEGHFHEHMQNQFLLDLEKLR